MKQQDEFRLIIGKYSFRYKLGLWLQIMVKYDYIWGNMILAILYLGAEGDVGAGGIQQLGNAPEERRNVGQLKVVRWDDKQSVIILGCRHALKCALRWPSFGPPRAAWKAWPTHKKNTKLLLMRSRVGGGRAARPAAGPWLRERAYTGPHTHKMYTKLIQDYL